MIARPGLLHVGSQNIAAAGLRHTGQTVVMSGRNGTLEAERMLEPGTGDLLDASLAYCSSVSPCTCSPRSKWCE
jgi:hypothetical protein